MTDLSIIIPCLNAAGTLGPVLDAVEGAPTVEIIIVDGGSGDGTADVAEGRGATVLASAQGRGQQMRAGAVAARGPWLLFLHADTRLDPGWRLAAISFMADPDNLGRAAAYRLLLDSDHPAARRVERLVAWRCRLFGLPWGDQGLLIHRDFLAMLGGYPDQPLMEDVALVRRIGRRRLTLLDAAATTSAVRYDRDGWLRRPLRNLTLLILYFAGVPPRLLARMYG
ncbi:MAG: TIGR04283 family arsenosugar biosynthesis glycosyltransferase [Minwuia sp.]|nr:TIGR04283 family arsenosugar biosynthesis glycosyltransferase [Minwuia sp.]